MTGRAEEIFGVEIDRINCQTLEEAKVDAELASKRQLLDEIRNIEKTLPLDERDWIEYFRKVVNADAKIIASLFVHLSFLNTDHFQNINNNTALKQLVSDADWQIIQSGLQDYSKLLQTFSFGEIVWKRTFLQNPFENFFTKVKAQDPNYLLHRKLKVAFKDAYQPVSKIQSQMSRIVSGMASSLSNQRAQSKVVMGELRDLDHFAVRSTKGKIEEQVKNTIKAFKKLLKSIENVNKIPKMWQFFFPKKSWIDNIIVQLEANELAHKNLDIVLNTIMP